MRDYGPGTSPKPYGGKWQHRLEGCLFTVFGAMFGAVVGGVFGYLVGVGYMNVFGFTGFGAGAVAMGFVAVGTLIGLLLGSVLGLRSWGRTDS